MESYKSYFDRQTVSPELHEKLLAIGRQPRTERRRRPLSPAWKKWAALAACCALALGLGLWRLSAPGETGSGACVPPAVSSPPEDSSSHSGENRESGFQVEGSETTGTAFLPAIPYIHYPDVGDRPAADTSPSRMMLAGSYSVELTKEDVQKIFWGPEGKPEGADGDLPWMLFWGNFFLSGSALYDGEGELLWLTLKGNSAAQALSFTLTLRPGELPFQCGLYSDLETTHVNGTPVTGWSRREDLNGDGVPDARCVSEFMAGEVGVRFEAACTAGEDSMDAAAWYSALLVGQTLSGGVYLGDLLTNGEVPAWREETFSCLEQAREQAAFAPYLPETDIPGYGEFYAALSYQEGVRNRLTVRWSRGYDDVSVTVSLPEGTPTYHLADVNRPEEYDLSLYSIPWCDSVPEEYRETVNFPTFRAEDLSLQVVAARANEKDTGGLSFSFGVLHGDGTLVEYRCDGLTAQAVWQLVEETLPPASP
ncbi:hypothetical protein [Pseudoflavonifractor capillosus]|uniref:hypothetical protein n=1 Tax=Pseudoflavonifractor capillosus TaxID=106588 RepID=UPI001957784E|nr:hypothetical protein [Pseudoflavonifractor capillosus]MBM6681171.1 hypothetical protein [Pseudoflavonifractor capillosus]